MVSSPNGNNGNGYHGPDGKFKKGNKGGPGNPFANRVHEYRQAIWRAVTPADLEEVMRTVLAAAKGGDIAAAKELFDRVLGKPKQQVKVDDPGWRNFVTKFEGGRLVATQEADDLDP